MMDLSVVPYGETARSKAELGGGGGRYRECMRNHAAAIGGQAYDGCGEFMPGGETGSLEALKCAACGCHRNFHRRDGGDRRRPLLLAWNGKNSIPPPPPPPGFPAFFPPPMPFHQIPPPPPPPPSVFHQSLDPNRVGSETPPRREEAMIDGGGGGERSAMRKRYRTKFTSEQKEKMQAFAEKLGWRIQKHDDTALEEFCVEIGVKRHVLKVWMHNNKSHLSSTPPSTATSATGNGDPAAAAAPPISV